DDDHDGVDDGCDECVGPGFVGMDTNDDGVDDGCTLVCPNPNGMDVDGDMVDDGCDACLLGSPHDEDEDGGADACDTRPSIVDSGTSVAGDGDKFGDQCDRSPNDDAQIVFDAFTSDNLAAWQPGGTEFVVG